MAGITSHSMASDSFIGMVRANAGRYGFLWHQSDLAFFQLSSISVPPDELTAAGH
jgi:hypothetical protein